MNFEHPVILFFLLPLAILGIGYLWMGRFAAIKRRIPFLILSLAFLLAVVAKPYWGFAPVQKKIRQVDLILALDVSQSMFCENADGVRRMDQVRTFLRGLLPEFTGNQIAVIYFSGDAQIGTPFTADQRAVFLFLDSIGPGMGTSPGTHLENFQQALKDLLIDRPIANLQTASKPLILFFGDGEFQDDWRNAARRLSRNKNLRFFVFSVGMEKLPVPKYDLSGPYPGAFSEANPDNMKTLAETVGGRAFDISVTRPESVAKEVMHEVSSVLVQGEAVPLYQPVPFLLLAIFFLILYRMSPLWTASVTKALPIAILCFASAALLAMRSADQRADLFVEAMKEMKEGNHKEALARLQDLQSERNAAELEIAIGNLYFFQKEYDEAIRHYRSALEMRPSDKRARWNWEVAIKHQGQNQSQDQDTPPPPPQEGPTPLPDQTQALLQYFDQLEKEQLRQQNTRTEEQEFAW